jgi:hypothetical protein
MRTPLVGATPRALTHGKWSDPAGALRRAVVHSPAQVDEAGVFAPRRRNEMMSLTCRGA